MKNVFLDSVIEEIQDGINSQNIEQVQLGLQKLLIKSQDYRNYPDIKIDLELVGTPRTRDLYNLYKFKKYLNEECLDKIWEEFDQFFGMNLKVSDLEHLERRTKSIESSTSYMKKRSIKLMKILQGFQLEKKHQFGGYGKKFYKNLAEIIINDFKHPEIICEILKNEKSLISLLSGYRRGI